VLFSAIVSRRQVLTLILLSASALSLAACGGGPGSPTDPGSTPTPGHPVSGFVYYDEDGDGVLGASETVRLPGVTVSIGGRTGQTSTDGRFTVTDVPAGAQSAVPTAASLPAYFTAEAAVPVTVPQSGGDVAVPATVPIAPNHANVYMAFGDSITAGNGAGPGEAYPDWLREDLRAYWGKADTINAGDPGTKSNQGESRLLNLLAKHRPAYVLILYGTNDWNEPRCRNPETFPCFTIDALRSMINQTRDFGAQPILGTIPPVNPAYQDRFPVERNQWVVDMNVELRAMAQQEQVQIAEVHADFMAEPALTPLFSDFLHPNAEGYRVMSRSWFNAITRPYGANASSRSRGLFGFFLGPSGS
jgi:acyl-CoA thioesterase-1